MERGKEITVHLAGGDLMIAWTEEGNVLMKDRYIRRRVQQGAHTSLHLQHLLTYL